MFKAEDVVFRYSEEEAVDDGILFAVEQLNKDWSVKGLFSHVTTNLLERQGYFLPGSEGSRAVVSVPCVVDLLNSCLGIVARGLKEDPSETYMFTGKVEDPNGELFTVWCVANGVGKLTIMLPEDY